MMSFLEYLISGRPGRVFFSVLAASVFVLGLAAGTQTKAQEDHSAHENMLTPEVLAVLRSKIPLYQELTDQEIAAGMERMGPNYRVYVSDKSVQGDIAILGLGHGFNEPGNTQFREAFEPISKTYPTAVGYGMAMMTSAHIQTAVDDLVAAGAKTIVVIPTTYTSFNNLSRQWDYIFGRHDVSSYLDVPHVQTEATVVFAPPQTDSPIIADILVELAQDISTDPENELLIVASHGPTDAKENEMELVLLENHAELMRQKSNFSGIKVITLQDDAPTAIRAANVEKFRGWVESAVTEGKRVLVVSNLLTTSGVHRKIKRDLDGLDYEFNTTGLMLHPMFQNWIEHAVSEALTES
jgi:sirohydrochlorin ferrochelatase